MDGKSKDLKAGKMEILKQQFPEVFSEGRLDVEKLKQSFDEGMVAGDERYRLEWAGKHTVFEEIAKRTTTTLTPDLERSVDFDTSKNVFIEGENLEVLRVLQKAYYNKVKMIYIDPPYNTGNDFVYNDNFRETAAEYDEAAGNLDGNGNLARAFTLNSKDSGQYHSNWMNMMYPRLFLARNLLRDDGVIFVSIDDNEVHNLRMLMNEIFGEENFIGQLIWEKRVTRENRRLISVRHDYVLFYCKSESIMESAISLSPLTQEARDRYKNPDDDPRGLWTSAPATAQAGHGTKGQFYELATPSGRKLQPPTGRCWLYTEVRMQEEISKNNIWFGADGNGVPRIKKFLNEGRQGLTPETLWSSKFAGTNDSAKRSLKELFDGLSVFDTPKPVDLVKRMLEIGTDKDALVMDFFTGSAPTAHAVMLQNAEDEGNRQYICAQLPEVTPEDSEARKAGYKTIADIAIERIKRAAKKIKEENPDFKGDLGVKVYKQTLSHFPAWRAESFESDEALQLSLGSFAGQKALGDARARAVELLLKLGYDLNTALEAKNGYYSAANGEVLLAVDAEADAQLEKLLAAKPSVVVVLEQAFKTDDEKINFALACKEKNVTFQTV